MMLHDSRCPEHTEVKEATDLKNGAPEATKETEKKAF
jgi:hypothetical protein